MNINGHNLATKEQILAYCQEWNRANTRRERLEARRKFEASFNPVIKFDITITPPRPTDKPGRWE